MKKLVLALLLAATPAQAQTAAPAEPETVYSDAQWRQDYSRSAQTLNALVLPVPGLEGQYARWKSPVCFNVYGLAPAAKYVMERRMREVTARVGAPLDTNEGCTPNVTVVFTVDPEATRQSIWKVRPWLVPGLGMIRNRVRQEQPIQAWYAGALRDPSGGLILWDGFDDEFHSFSSNTMTRLNSDIQTALDAVTIIVDINAVMGQQLGALADHFVMLSLTEALFTRSCRDVETIANLMKKDCDAGLKATEMTQNDLVLLTGLYKTDDNWMQTLQRARLLGQMRKEFEAEYISEKGK